MKKYLSAPLAIIIVLSMLFACSCSKYQNGRLVVDKEGEGPVGAVYIPEEEQKEEEPVATEDETKEKSAADVVIDLDVLTEENLATMLPIMTKIMEYLSTNNYTLDLSDPDKEEFWNVIAVSLTYSENAKQYLDSDNVFHVKKAVLVEYAKTFLSQAYSKTGIPSYKNCYCVSYDPGPSTYDINYLSLNNKKITLVSIAPSDVKGDYVVTLLIEDAEEITDDYQAPVTQYMYIQKWEDSASHTFPYQLVY